jgi:hypothetical protein
MYIYVDESGSFTAPTVAPPPDSWCVVACYVSPEQDEGRLSALMQKLREDCGGGAEVKINEIPVARYIRWLRDISRLSGIVFAVAVDVSLHAAEAIREHRQGQADAIAKHREKLIHETARQQLTQLSDDVLSLPAQLYTQLQCQVMLFHKALTLAPLYYAQFKPETLGRFAWRVDRKDTILTAYEDAFKRVLASMMQTASLREPMIMLEGKLRATCSV